MNFTFEAVVTHEADVCVFGGGPAGFCAALASARNGAKTILVEQNGFCGGMATAGLVGPFMTCYNKSGDKMIIRGLFEEVVNRLIEKGGAIHPSRVPAGSAFTSYITIGHNHVTPFDPETLRIVIDEMLTQAGVEVIYHTTFVQPVIDKSTITGAVVSSKNGFEAINAKVVIDATGDADVAFRAGVPCELGDEESGRIQPATMFFRIGNVQSNKVEADIRAHIHDFYRKDGVNYRSFHWHVSEAKANGDWDLNRVSIGMFRGVKEDEWSVNTSRIMKVDGTNAESLTMAEIEGRRQAKEIFDFIRKYIPGCENAKLLSTGSTVGIRETRHIKGDYVLQLDDVLHGLVPEDSILLAANSVDVHGRFGPLSNEYLTVENGEWYGVPYRCLLPKGVENLLVAGRSISAASEAAGAIRVMPPCMAIGQAAGTAAALSIQNNCTPRMVNVHVLQQTLKKQKAFLGD